MPSTDSDQFEADDGRRPDETHPDGGTGLTERQMYEAVHAAVRNAIWDVVGTVVLTLFALAVFCLGLLMLANGLSTPGEPRLTVVVLGTAVAGLSGVGLLRLYDYV